MRKLFVFIFAVLLIYLVINKNKPKPKKVEITEAEVNHGLTAQPNPTNVANHKTPSPSVASATAVGPIDNTSLPPVATTASENDSPPDNRNLKISDLDPGYTPPAFLTGTSAQVASLVHVNKILVSATIRDIKTAFDKGAYLSKFISEGLHLHGSRRGWVDFDDDQRPFLDLTMDLNVNYQTNPLQGILSLKADQIEKSCNATTVGPLKNISMLSEENSVLLIMSCDKSFYMQLYYYGKKDLTGNFYERNASDGSYRRTGEVLLAWKYND